MKITNNFNLYLWSKKYNYLIVSKDSYKDDKFNESSNYWKYF
jgi:hypothetical protein